MGLFEHFRPEERPFIERAMEWMDQVEHQYRQRLTDFLDPRQVYILRLLCGRYTEVQMFAFGGYPGAERCRVLLHPSFFEPSAEDMGLTVFEVTSPSPGLSGLKHKDFLGALLNIGLKREKFGDIVIHNGRIQIVAAEETADFVRLHLTQVHRIHVLLESVREEEILTPAQEWKEISVTVPSQRVDVVAGDVFRLSRSKILPPIRAGHLKVNWMVTDSPSFLVRAGDVVSLRGYGRFKVLSEEGETKKGKTRLVVGILQ